MLLPDDVLRHYVERHNRGVGDGDFRPLLEMFRTDARLELEDTGLGPFVGKPAIARAFAEHPPSDALVVLGSSSPDSSSVEADYAWRSAPGVRAGTLRIELVDAAISRLLVTTRRS